MNNWEEINEKLTKTTEKIFEGHNLKSLSDMKKEI